MRIRTVRARPGSEDTDVRLDRRSTVRTAVLFAAFVVVTGLFTAYLLVNPMQRLFDQDARIAEVDSRNTQLTSMIDDLEARQARLRDDTTVERLARELLGLVMPGEKPVLISPETPDSGGSAPSTGPESADE